MKKIAVVGAGFSGATIAQELARAGHSVDVFESRPHVAGNCYTYRDPDTDVMVHKYGPHIFHTDNERVWEYVKRFGEMVPYNHRVKAVATDGRVYSLPINLHTINQFFGTSFSPDTAKIAIGSLCEDIPNPKTFEEQALAFVGKELYEAFLRDYTIKQWGRRPSALPASVLKRLPLRFDYNDSYFSHPYQAIPREGYTEIVKAMLDHRRIALHLRSPFGMHQKNIAARGHWDHVFYSGPLDAWYNYKFGRLAYRTLDFQTVIRRGDYLGCPVMNYTGANVRFTRMTDFKYFTPWEKHDKSFVYVEYSHEAGVEDDLYYPIRLAEDTAMLAEYTACAAAEKHVTFIGRLGTYSYLDMDVTIAQALTAADIFLDRTQ